MLGVILVILGVYCYLATDRVSVTALIPTAFGAVFMVLGVLGAQESLRKHAMHAAAALGAVGFVFAVVRVIMVLVQGRELGTAFVETAVFGGLCGGFVALCVKSFIDARRRRSQQEGT
jgi:hypothetical protein